MKAWFDGSNEIECSLERVKEDIKDLGKHYAGMISFIPDISQVELEDQGDNWITIKSKECVIKRTNIVKRIEKESVLIEFDEEFLAGKIISIKTHLLDEFTATRTGLRHRTVINVVKAKGLFGFFYRKFAGSDVGKNLLNSYKSYLESR